MLRKVILLLALLIAPLVTYAQPKCWPNLESGSILTVKLATTEVAKVGDMVYIASPIGLVWGYSCLKDGLLYHVIAGGPWTSFPAEWAYLADGLMRDTEAARNAAWIKYAVTTTIDSRLQPDVDKIKTLLPVPAPVPPPPAPGTYVVAPTSICVTADKDAIGKCIRRSTYAWINNVRGAMALEKVDIGTPCNPAVGTAGYYGVLGRTDRVAPCVKK